LRNFSPVNLMKNNNPLKKYINNSFKNIDKKNYI